VIEEELAGALDHGRQREEHADLGGLPTGQVSFGVQDHPEHAQTGRLHAERTEQPQEEVGAVLHARLQRGAKGDPKGPDLAQHQPPWMVR
jgi:hypothetical protein